jgi:hypothetical protein
MDDEERNRRIREIDDFLFSYIDDEKERHSDGEIGIRLLTHLLRDIPGDLGESLRKYWPVPNPIWSRNRAEFKDRALVSLIAILVGVAVSWLISTQGSWLGVAGFIATCTIVLAVAAAFVERTG